MTPKPWYSSWTLWFNLAALQLLPAVGSIVVAAGWMNAALFATIATNLTAIANLLLRMKTDAPLIGGSPEAK